jgi:protoporphyrinogen oxidase
MPSRKVAVLGAGPMGLAAAYYLLRKGHAVTLIEASPTPGGMAAHFDFEGLSIERYYHFVCKADQPLFDLLRELDLGDAMRWRDTRMAYYFEGKLYPWGDPLSLLRFPHLDLISKLRYGLLTFSSTKRSNWDKLDKITAIEWIKKNCGERGWRVLWEKLFTLKFFEYTDQISAAWIWTRIKRVGTSRRSLLQEQLGYIEGGSETLIRGLMERIEALGGEVFLGKPVTKVHIDNDRVTGVSWDQAFQPFDHVISTIPLPLIPKIADDLPAGLLERYAALKNIGVVCVIHKLKRKVTDYFWINTNDPRIQVPGLVEFSNLRGTDPYHIVYVPYYMPQGHPKFNMSDEEFIEESFSYLRLLNPDITVDDRMTSRVGRLYYAQPICTTNFLDKLPPIETGIRGLQIADTSSYYPEDRGVSESARLARIMAERVE